MELYSLEFHIAMKNGPEIVDLLLVGGVNPSEKYDSQLA